MDEKTVKAVLSLLAGLDGVAVARVSPEGRLLDAQGFIAALLPGGDVSGRFRVPSWAQLSGNTASDGSKPVFRGSLTLAVENGGEQALNGTLWREPAGFLLLAERPADDMEHLSKSTVRLSNELAAIRRELADAKGDLHVREEQVRVMSFVDRITGLGNQRAFNQALAAEVLRVGRYGGPLCLVLASIDGLEGIVEQLGDDRADDVMRCFARVVCNETRKTDHACRVGENRFMLMLTQTSTERAAGVSERIRVAFAAASPGMVATRVTASFGHANWREGDDATSLVDRVETALGAAKAAGGDRIESA